MRAWRPEGPWRQQLEVERKFVAPGTMGLLELCDGLVGTAGIAAVEPGSAATLLARYFDTADLRLAAYRVTLRRRAGGDDDGWTLKLPAGPDARQEITVPLGHLRKPPRELAVLVRGFCAGAPLGPVVDIRTRRASARLVADDGALLAIVTLDRVLGTPAGATRPTTSWRELEVELAAGDRALLERVSEHLLARGAIVSAAPSKMSQALGARVVPAAALRPVDRIRRRTPVLAVASAYLGRQVLTLATTDPLVRMGRPDALHQMRVAARRLRSALATYDKVLDRAVTDPLRQELQWLGRELGAARDAEVVHSRVLELLADLPDPLVGASDAARIAAELDARYRAAHAHALRALDGTRYAALRVALERLGEQPPLLPGAAQPAGDVLTDLLDRSRRRVRRLAARADAATEHPAHEAALHEVRKAAKRARYAGESAVPMLGRAAARFADAMADLQSGLGALQDSSATRLALRELETVAAAEGRGTFEYGVLAGADREDAAAALAAYPRLLRAATRRAALPAAR